MEENLKKEAHPFNKTMLLVLGLVILTGVLLFISLSQKPSLFPSVAKKEEVNFAKTSLSISEDVRTSSRSGTYEVDVNIDSSDNKVTGLQLELSFNPAVLTKVDIEPGDFLTNPVVILKKIDSLNGRISYLLGGQIGEKGVSGRGTVAVISFSKTGSEETSIDFLPQTIVTAQGFDQNVLSETVSGIITSTSSPTISP